MPLASCLAITTIFNAHLLTLELNVQRLKNLRLAVIDEIEKELDDETIDINDLEEKIAAEYFGNGTDNWPPFFTTLRWVLGAGAERHLINISYSEK